MSLRNYWSEHDGPQPTPAEELKQRGLRSLLGILAATALVSALFLVASLAHAQTFDATVTSGQAPLSTVLTWSVPNAVSCTASGGGSPGWQGTVATSGKRTLTGIGVPMTLRLDCLQRGSALLTWQPGAPVVGADVTAWRLLWGDSATTLTQTLDVNVPGATSFRIDGIDPGPKSFAVRALAGTRESVNSNVASKTVAGEPWSKSIDITILPPPNPNPPVLTVTDVTAFEIKQNSTGAWTKTRVAYVQPGMTCDPTQQRTVGTITYTLIPMVKPHYIGQEGVDFANFATAVKFTQLWARCS